MNKKLLTNLTLALAIVSLTSAVALAENSTKLRVTSTVSFNGVQITPGNYKVTWQTHSPILSVRLKKGNKVVATGEGRLVDRNLKYNRSAIIYKTNPDGTRTLIEIRLGGKNKAIVFDQ